MLLPDNFADLLSEGLFQAKHAQLDNLKSPLLSPCNFPKIASEIHKIHVCFSMCLVVKQRIREKNIHSFLITREKPTGEGIAWKMYQVQKIANLNRLYLSLKQQAAAPRYYNDKHSTNSTNPVLLPDYSQFSQTTQAESQQSKIFWLQNLNYLQLFLSSLKTHYENDANIRSSQWDQGVLKLRDEVMAKLIIESLDTCQRDNTNSPNFQFFLKYIESFLPQDPKVIAQRMINIIHESICYLRNEMEGFTQMNTFQKHGANILSFMLNLIQKILPICKHRVDYVVKLIESIYNLLKLAFLDEQDTSANNEEECDHQFFNMNDGETIPSWFREYSQKMLDVLQQSMRIALRSRQHQESIVIKALALLRLASKNQLLGDFGNTTFGKVKDANYAKQKNMFYIYDILAQIIQFSAGKLSTYWLESQSNTNFYLEYSITHTLMKILSSHSAYTMTQKRLITMVCEQYFPLILQKIRIQTENGLKNPIPMMSLFMQKMSSLMNEQLMRRLEENVSLLFSKFLTEAYQQTFTTYTEQIQACSDYFGPIIKLLLAIKSKKKTEGTHVSIIIKQSENVFTNDLRTSNYLLRLSVQQIRQMKMAIYQPYRDEICQLSLFLLQHLRFSSYKVEYLMLLEVLMDLLVEDDSADFDSQLWYYLRNKLPISLPVFIKNIANELVNLLLTQRSEYFVQSAVDILYRTYKKLKKIDIEKIQAEIPQDQTEKLLLSQQNKLSELLKIYFQPVYTLIQEIESSVLHNLKHYNSRKKVFQLIAIIEIHNVKDLYAIYYKLLYSKHNLTTELGIFYYFIDAFGIFAADIDCKYKTALMELIIAQIEQNQNILSMFSLECLRANELALEVFCRFVDNFLHCWPTVTHQVYYFCKKIRKQLSQKVRILPNLYEVENAHQLTTIYQAYQRLDKFQIALPQFPEKIYQLQNAYSIDLFRCYLLNSLRHNKTDQVMRIFRNIYERKNINWTFEENEVKAHEQILSTVQKIEVLAYFSDYLERSKMSVFFDYQRLIARLMRTLFEEFVDRYSLNSIDIGSFDDTDNEEDTPDFIEQFFKTISQIKSIKKLVQAEYNFNLIAHSNEISYCQFESRCLSKAKCLLYAQKATRK